MGQSLNNIIAAVILIVVGAVGYFMYIQKDATLLTISLDDPTTSRLITEARTFIEKRRILQSISLNTTLLDNQSFLDLQKFADPVPEQPIGKNSLFEERKAIIVP